MNKIQSLLIFSVYFGLLFLLMPQSLDKDYIKDVEKKWNIDDIAKPKTEDISYKSVNLFPPFLEYHKPNFQTFHLYPYKDNTIRGVQGTEIMIPANSFLLPKKYNSKDSITIELIEIQNDLDFLTYGVDMFYLHKNKFYVFESGGMFEIRAMYFDREIKLKSSAKIQVTLREIASNRKMKLYKYENKEIWTETRDSSITTPTNVEVRISIASIDSLGIWNIDYPNPDIGCVEATVKSSTKPPFIISVIGQDYAGAFSRSFNSNQFKINVPKSKKLKLLASDSKGNLGYIDIQSTNQGSFLSYKNYNSIVCDKVAEIEIQPTDHELRKDRKKLLQYLNLSDRY